MTSAITIDGWGGGPWGSSFWGGGDASDLRLINAIAIRENVVRLQFNVAPEFNQLLTARDASYKRRYSVTVIDGSRGLDGELVRLVSPLYAEQSPIDGSAGRYLDLSVDRPFTHYPAQYRISVNNLFSVDGFPLDVNYTSFVFYGLHREYIVPIPSKVMQSRDLANAMTLSSLLSKVPNPDESLLGSIPVDETGDYAFDEGIVNLKKRIFRRLITTPGGFAHLPSYGVGVLNEIKKLGTAAVRARIALEAEKQIAQEPDVERVKTNIISDDRNPSLIRVIVLVLTKYSPQGVKFDYPFQAIE